MNKSGPELCFRNASCVGYAGWAACSKCSKSIKTISPVYSHEMDKNKFWYIILREAGLEELAGWLTPYVGGIS
jgi:hypothetical protein